MENQLNPKPYYDVILDKEVIEHEDLKNLDLEQLWMVQMRCHYRMNEAQGAEKKAFAKKLRFIKGEGLRGYNHHKIEEAIDSYMSKFNMMPAINQIARLTGLSRPTVRRHLKDFNDGETAQTFWKSYEIMLHKIMPKLLLKVRDGDLKTTKVFLDFMKHRHQLAQSNAIGQQNNFLQINNTVINQQLIQQLSPAQLAQIEEIVTALPIQKKHPLKLKRGGTPPTFVTT